MYYILNFIIITKKSFKKWNQREDNLLLFSKICYSYNFGSWFNFVSKKEMILVAAQFVVSKKWNHFLLVLCHQIVSFIGFLYKLANHFWFFKRFFGWHLCVYFSPETLGRIDFSVFFFFLNSEIDFSAFK